MDVLWALLLIGLALFLGALLLRRLPASWLVFGAIAVVFGFGIPALVIDDHKSTGGGGAVAASPSTGGASTTTTTTPTTTTGGGAKPSGGTTGGGGAASAAVLAQGKQLFQQTCGTCHTLANAGTSGSVGPNLDQVKPSKQLVLSALKNGGLGSGTMPKNLYVGKDAQTVATYVSTVAGQ